MSDAGEIETDKQEASNIAVLHPDGPLHRRTIEALLFASAEPLDEAALGMRLPAGVDVASLLAELVEDYARRGVNLVRVAGKWAFRTAPDLAFLLRRETERDRRLSRAAIETLAIIAYHQPVTRSEIEDIRGVSVSRGTLELLLETEWIRPRGRRRTPGRPLTFGTTEAFETHFGLESLKDLPGLEELKAAGLLDMRLPTDFTVNIPDPDAGQEDEDPLDLDDPLPELRRGAAGKAEVEATDATSAFPSNVIAGPGLRETLEEVESPEN
ncbi:MAG TPA: SMC-Scp complex subunit ScpB [Alphaproteobacteria bacterium]|nr:SMC-Scp complex subunit ScpB [Alphaproteobacteria bacterium]